MRSSVRAAAQRAGSNEASSEQWSITIGPEHLPNILTYRNYNGTNVALPCSRVPCTIPAVHLHARYLTKTVVEVFTK